MMPFQPDNTHPEKLSLSLGLFFLIFSISLLFAFYIVATLAALFSASERIVLLEIILVVSLFFFMIVFWKETGGDFFSFINITLVGYFMMFALPACFTLNIPQAYTKRGYWDINSAEYTMVLLILALYLLVLGYKVAMRNRSGIMLPFCTNPSIRKIGIAFLFCVAMWLFCCFIKSSLMGIDISKLLGYHTRNETITQAYRTGIFSVIDFFDRGAQYIFLLCLLLPRDGRIKKGIILGANLFIFSFILNTIVNGIFMTAKSAIFTVLFIFICFQHYARQRIRIRRLLLVVSICIFVVVMFNYQRTGVDWQRKHSRIIDIVKDAPRLYVNTFEDFEGFSLTVHHFPQLQPYYFGCKLFEEIVYLPIPRFLWKNKPIAYGSRAILYDIEPQFFTAGYCAGPHSQFYADFGLAGIIVGFFVFGWIIGWVYDTFRRNSSNKGVVILYTLIIANTWLYFKGGFPWLNLIIMVYIPFYILLWYIYPQKANCIEMKDGNS